MFRNVLKALGSAAVVAMTMNATDADAGIRSFSGTGCVKYGPAAGQAGTVTQICGYHNDSLVAANTATSVYVDFNRQLSQAATVRACRRAYNNASFNCTNPANISAASGSVDYAGPVWAGLAGANTEFDYYSVELSYANLVGNQTQTVQMWGLGVSGP